jgi:hypothetical protein
MYADFIWNSRKQYVYFTLSKTDFHLFYLNILCFEIKFVGSPDLINTWISWQPCCKISVFLNAPKQGDVIQFWCNAQITYPLHIQVCDRRWIAVLMLLLLSRPTDHMQTSSHMKASLWSGKFNVRRGTLHILCTGLPRRHGLLHEAVHI